MSGLRQGKRMLSKISSVLIYDQTFEEAICQQYPLFALAHMTLTGQGQNHDLKVVQISVSFVCPTKQLGQNCIRFGS